MKYASLFALALLLLYFFAGCTSSPLGENQISLGKRQLKGSVLLSDGVPPSDIYVWLDGFNIGTRTDEKGHFDLVLPAPASQAGGGISGAFHIYYYLANYSLDSTLVGISKGEFIFGQNGVSSKGELVSPIRLPRKLKITTTAIPTFISVEELIMGTPRLVAISVELEAGNDPVTVIFPKQSGDILGPMIFRNTETNEAIFLGSTITGIPSPDTLTLQKSNLIRLVAVPMSPNLMPFGQYELIPFLYVKDDNVPDELIRSLGDGVFFLTANFLNLPMKRNTAVFSYQP